jgi:ribonuclease Z
LHFGQARSGTIARSDNYSVVATRSLHSVESFAYDFKENQRPGVFNDARAKALGIPEGQLWSKLQHGRSVKVAGRVVKPGDVLGSTRMERIVGVSGDTRPSRTLVAFFRRAQVLFFDSTYGESHRENARENMHSTALEAAKVAKSSGVDLLVLTHFSARYANVSTLLKQARVVHKNTIAARDQMVIEVPFPERGHPFELTTR